MSFKVFKLPPGGDGKAKITWKTEKKKSTGPSKAEQQRGLANTFPFAS